MSDKSDQQLVVPLASLAAANLQIIELTKELDAYRKAKSENDERYMRERDEARARLAEAEAGRDEHLMEAGLLSAHLVEAETARDIAFTMGARTGWIQSLFFHSGIPEDGSVSVAIEARTGDEMRRRWPLATDEEAAPEASQGQSAEERPAAAPTGELDLLVALLTAPARYEVSVFGTLMVRPLEDGKFAVTELKAGGFERSWSTAEMAAADFLGTRCAMRLGRDFEGTPPPSLRVPVAVELGLLRELEASCRARRPNGFRRNGRGDDTWMEDVLTKLDAHRPQK